MKRIQTILLLCFFFIGIDAKEIKYPAFTISDSLKENAFAVVRNEKITYEVISFFQTKTEVIHAITILNENGRKHAWEYLHYDKDKKIKNFELKIYNSLGILEDTWHQNDLEDVSSDPYGTTYSDTRLLIAKPVVNNYPYTVEYCYSYETNNSFFTKVWYPTWYNNVSVEKSSFKIIFAQDVELNIKELNLDSSIVKFQGNENIEWIITNWYAKKSVPYSLAKEEYLPHIKITSANFAYDDYTGEMKSWQSFGRFISSLNEGRDILPEESILKIKSISDSCSGITSKVKSLYEYMQSHTRYVSIQVGIGGWQPFPASTVAGTGYGDCKALSNYMMTILKYAGIKSYYTLVRSGAFKYYFDTEFVCNQFNHVILSVPVDGNDTIWLECTSQTMPFNFLGDFTDNRPVLLITENGGVLTKTPKYTKEQNKIIRTGNFSIDENGNGQGKLNSIYTGLEYYEMHSIAIEDEEEQRKMLYDNYDIPNYEITSFILNTNNILSPELDENLNLSLHSYASKTGTRLFLPLNIVSKWNRVPEETKDRKLDIHKKYEASYTDTIIYTLPDGYSVEVIPKIERIESDFGWYNAQVSLEDNQAIYVRNFGINSGVYPSTSYEQFRSFFKEVRKNDGATVVLKKE
jgi:transglutaminase-like putative cysteine protease